MESRVRSERELAKIALLHLDEVFLVLGAQTFQNGGVDHNSQLEVRLVPRTLLQYFAQFPLNLDTHRQGALDLAPAFAIRAVIVHCGMHAFGMTLTRHFQQAKLGNGQDMRLGLITAQTLFHALIHLLLVAARFHVNEVEHDQAAHVAKAQLAGNFIGGLQVHLKDG